MARKTSAPPPEPEFTAEELEQLGQSPSSEMSDEELHQADDDGFDMENYRPDDEDDNEEQPTKKNSEEEGEDEAEDSEPSDAKKNQKVPYGALHKERAIRKEIQQERDQWRERNTLLEQRLNIILQRMATPEQPEKPAEDPDPMPDMQNQPFEYIEWQQRRLQALEAKVNGREQQEQRQTVEQQIIQRGTSLAMEVRNQNPEEYDAALDFVTNLRVGQLRALGMDNHSIEQTVQTELRNGMITALQRNINPGKFLLDFAKNSGFVFKKPDAQQQQNPIKKLQENVQKNKTLGQSPKHGSTGTLTAEDIAEMSDDEFEAFYSKVGKKGFAKKFAM